jgi:hypothetical protein
MDDETRERLLRFERRLLADEFSVAAFTRIFDEISSLQSHNLLEVMLTNKAAQCMGVPGPNREFGKLGEAFLT